MKLAADANALLSAVIGGRSGLVLDHPSIEEVFPTAHTFSEVEEYAPILAEKRGLASDVIILAVAALPVTVVERSRYARKLPEARKQMRDRDPDDAELLALALQLKVPIWSNDKDFESASIERYTTEDLLRHLDIIE